MLQNTAMFKNRYYVGKCSEIYSHTHIQTHTHTSLKLQVKMNIS